MEPQSNETSQASSKVSSSDLDITLMRLSLAKANRLVGEVSDEGVRELYAKWKAEREAAPAAAEEARKKQMLDAAKITARQAEAARVRREREAKRNAEEQEDRRKWLRESLFKKSECPERHKLNLDRVDEGQNPKWIELRDTLVRQTSYASGFMVALLGKRGVGKTQLTVSAIHRLCGQLVTCRYVKAIDLFRDLRRAYAPVAKGERGQSEEGIIEGWVKVDFLVIDDCHQRGETNWEQDMLTNLLDRRYDERKCTVLIANHTKEEFGAAMGDSVVSRIHETGEAIICDWESYRKPKAGWKKGDGDELRTPSGLPPSPKAVTYGER